MKLADRIVIAVRERMPEGMTRAHITTLLAAPSGSVRREVQTLIYAGALVDNAPDPKYEGRPTKRLTVPVDEYVPQTLSVHREATATFESRFWMNVNQEAPKGCWLWTGPINTEQQGVFFVAGQGVRARRLSVELSLGHSVKRLGICEHSRLCVNPAHLQKPDPQQELPLPEPAPAPKAKGKAKAR